VGLFSFFKTKPAVPDRIWMTPQAKLNGIAAEVHERLQEGQIVIVVAHFPATLAQVEENLKAADLPNGFHDGRLSRKEIGRQKVILVLAASLASNDMPLEINHTLDGLAILVAERHFLRAKDDAILSFARTLGRPSEVVFHLSLHDHLMKQFAGDWVENVLKRLGMDESERIDSSMVARRIKGAQAKFSSGVFSDRRADSAEEWLRLNVPRMSV
jgi:preprotein translocase subunit SecA